jgi:L-ribulose-5-phosphate 4-epimerase
VEKEYEKNTGKIIAERFKELDPLTMPGVLVAGHAPFSFGKNAEESVRNGLILERVAEMALYTVRFNRDIKELPEYISEKHYKRKHGPHAYYGQK